NGTNAIEVSALNALEVAGGCFDSHPQHSRKLLIAIELEIDLPTEGDTREC
ncbi:MAG: hypothetical protein RLZZ87_24, partial [Actinomycetota bacterium]